jgi:hypothetical protein
MRDTHKKQALGAFARVQADTLKAPHPPSGHHPRLTSCLDLLPCHPLRTPLGQMLPLRNQTLMDGAGQQGHAVPADLVAEVLAGDADA